MSFYQYEFVRPIQKHSMGFNKKGELFYNVLYLPDALINTLPLDQYPRLRIEGEMHEQPFEGAVQPDKEKKYLLISQKFLSQHKLKLGDSVEVRFNIANQDHVNLPAELEQALHDNEKAFKLWSRFTPGKKRGFATSVLSAKQPATREKRARTAINHILNGKNAGGR
ncbi:MAG: YdeI/OmpD-associated family protein [Anaerolineae bacterium]